MRRKLKKRQEIKPELLYNSSRLEKFINCIMGQGKKNTARKVVYRTLELVKEKTKEDPILVFEAALKNTGPLMEVRSRRIGGANYQVPREVRPERRLALSMRWIIGAARAKRGMPMEKKLSQELLAASENQGDAVKKKENTHKMAEANKAFAHFSW